MFIEDLSWNFWLYSLASLASILAYYCDCKDSNNSKYVLGKIQRIGKIQQITVDGEQKDKDVEEDEKDNDNKAEAAGVEAHGEQHVGDGF